jgi:hypothetical protein
MGVFSKKNLKSKVNKGVSNVLGVVASSYNLGAKGVQAVSRKIIQKKHSRMASLAGGRRRRHKKGTRKFMK